MSSQGTAYRERMTGSCMNRQLFRERWSLTVKGEKVKIQEALRVCLATAIKHTLYLFTLTVLSLSLCK